MLGMSPGMMVDSGAASLLGGFTGEDFNDTSRGNLGYGPQASTAQNGSSGFTQDEQDQINRLSGESESLSTNLINGDMAPFELIGDDEFNSLFRFTKSEQDDIDRISRNSGILTTNLIGSDRDVVSEFKANFGIEDVPNNASYTVAEVVGLPEEHKIEPIDISFSRSVLDVLLVEPVGNNFSQLVSIEGLTRVGGVHINPISRNEITVLEQQQAKMDIISGPFMGVMSAGMSVARRSLNAVVPDRQLSKSKPLWDNSVSNVDGDFGYLPTFRQQYVNKVEDLKFNVNNMLADGVPIEDVGKYVYGERNGIKLWARESTPPELLEAINTRNLNKPGYDQLGPKLDYLLDKGKTWEQIIESATRSGGGDLF